MLRRISNAYRDVQNWVTKRRTMNNKFQEQLDTRTLYCLLAYYRNSNSGLKDLLKKKGLDDSQIVEEMSEIKLLNEMGYYDIRWHNINILDHQILKLFEDIEKKGGDNPYPKPVYKEKRKTDETEEYIMQRIKASDIDIYNPGKEIKHPDDFSLLIKKSNIDHPESGYGVYVKGTITPGTVIGFYPGVVFFPDNIIPNVLEGNDYLYCRYDHAIVDGYQWDKRQERMQLDRKKFEYSGAIHELSISTNKFRNPYGIINYVNHPPIGQKPNVMCYSYDFPDNFPETYKSYIPNEYYRPPSMFNNRADCHMRSVVCVANRVVKDEELFLNYRYNPNNPYPDWYEQPDLDEAKRRWGGRL